MMFLLNVDRLKEYSPTLVRLGMSAVFLWFGSSQLMDASSWIIWLPEFAHKLVVPAETWVMLNGLMEVVLGLCLLLGMFTRLVSLVLALHMLPIIFSIGYNDVGVRDFGLMIATFSVFLSGSQKWCLDSKLKQKAFFQQVPFKWLYFFDGGNNGEVRAKG